MSGDVFFKEEESTAVAFCERFCVVEFEKDGIELSDGVIEVAVSVDVAGVTITSVG